MFANLHVCGVTIQIPLVIASKAKQSKHRINGKIQQNRDFTD